MPNTDLPDGSDSGAESVRTIPCSAVLVVGMLVAVATQVDFAGCSDTPPPSPHTPHATDVPRQHMASVLSEGQVLIDEPDVLLIALPGREVDELTAETTIALVKDGWRKQNDRSKPGTTMLVYRKGRQRLGYASGPSLAGPFVYYEDLKSPEPHWMSGSARPGTIPPSPREPEDEG